MSSSLPALTIDGSQDQLDELLRGSEHNVDRVREQVFSLTVKQVGCIAEEWPALPLLQQLTIQVDSESLESFPKVLRGSGLPLLQRLTLGYARGKRSGDRPDCPVLEGCFEQLRHVSVQGLRLRAGAIQSILLCPISTLKLRLLGYGYDECSELLEGLQYYGCPTLTHLDLEESHIDGQQCGRLMRALQPPACRNSACVRLGVTRIGHERWKDLARGLQTYPCPRLTRLHLGRNYIGAEGSRRLVQALQEQACPALSHLDLQGNGIGDEGCVDVAQALQRHACSRLAYLDLGQNGVGDRGCAVLAQALKGRACPCLIYLNLASNDIGDEGCTALVRGLAGCPDIQDLLLPNNRIRALPDALGETRSLASLNIRSNLVRTIQPALHAFFLRLTAFAADGNPLEYPYQQHLGVIQGYLRMMHG